MENLEQTVEKSFLGKVKNNLRRVRDSVAGRVAVYSLIGVLSGGFGLSYGCGGAGKKAEAEVADAAMVEAYEAGGDTSPICIQDWDRDGFYAKTDMEGNYCGGSDCDDNDASVYPGAEEICDGKDNDCDGLTDGEDIADICRQRLECIDNDGDGYGIGKDCNIGGDCNDNDASIYPGAEEICDGKDNDCDGMTDEGETTEEGKLCNCGQYYGNYHAVSGKCCTDGDKGGLLCIVDSFGLIPGVLQSGLNGLTWKEGYLLGVSGTTNKVYWITTEGESTGSFWAPGKSPQGLAWDGAYLWIADAHDKNICQLAPLDGVVGCIDAPGEQPRGLAWDGLNLLMVDAKDKGVYRLTREGGVISFFYSPGNAPMGLEWNGENLMLTDSSDEKLYITTPYGQVVNSYDTPGEYPYGVAWDGENTWLTDNFWGKGRIYKMELK